MTSLFKTIIGIFSFFAKLAGPIEVVVGNPKKIMCSPTKGFLVSLDVTKIPFEFLCLMNSLIFLLGINVMFLLYLHFFMYDSKKRLLIDLRKINRLSSKNNDELIEKRL